LVVERIVSMTEIENGTCDLVDCLKLNAILDMRMASEWAAMKESRKG
jgi:hypothetical protein